MADANINIPLNAGLDLNSPALSKQPGTLVDCMNYEVTDLSGYRRIDGFEKFDGYQIAGATSAWLIRTSTPITGDYGLIQAGTAVYLTTGPATTDYFVAGYVMSGITLGEFFYVPLEITELPNVGEKLYFRRADLTFAPFTLTFAPVSMESSAPDTFLADWRATQSALRVATLDAPGPVIGLHWMDENLYAVVDMLEVTFSSSTALRPPIGTHIRWHGYRWRVSVRTNLTASSGTDTATYFLTRLYEEEGMLPSSTMETVTNDGVVIGTLVSALALPTVGYSHYAGLYRLNSQTDGVRAYVSLRPSFDVQYIHGEYTLATMPPTTTIDNYYYVKDTAGNVLRVAMQSITVDSGTFVAGDASGSAQLTVIARLSGTTDFIQGGSTVHTANPPDAGNEIFALSGTPTMAALPGSAQIKIARSKYVFNTANFYADERLLRSYGTNGAGRAFWFDKTGYGHITTQPSPTKDKPRHVCKYGDQLALGYHSGAVILSVSGQPLNYSGLLGAQEIAMADPIVGLLELQGDTLGVFCAGSVRRISGHTDADLQRQVLSSNSGAIEYTVCEVAGQPVYTSGSGITTLEQTAAYGDFVGKRVSSNVTAWLRPRLISDLTESQSVGVVCAYPVRNKNQYRLLLKDGNVVSCCFTDNGPAIMFNAYQLDGVSVTSFCVSSETDHRGVEQIHTAWDSRGRNWAAQSAVYALDVGWGFNGRTFPSRITLSHIFPLEGAEYSGVEWARLYGRSHGIASLNLKVASIEEDFDQAFHTTIQDISMPTTPQLYNPAIGAHTSIIDTATWGLGTKIQIQGTINGPTLTEPSHRLQVLVLRVRSQGAQDN